ncbi:MAG: DUF2207 domain-containing protein [Lachnospiraceae bacterium]|nr:DUF2207 domain-containing protein [Lachnospiraceae bacterium]
MKKMLYAFVCLAAAALCFLGGGALESVSRSEQTPTYDSAMDTQSYATQVEVLEDGSYQIEERIQVDMLEERHGVYRYIPQYGPSVYRNESGEFQKVPYCGKVELLKANAPVDISNENGCTVFRLGSEDETVYGPTEYVLRYRFTPQFQDKGYANAYYNVFPGMWQNAIPAGSSFSVIFPKDFDHEKLKLYTGAYGSQKDAAEILKLRWSGNTVKGTLKRDLKLGEGVTFFAAMPEGYFKETHTLVWPKILSLVLSLICFVSAVGMFLAFGRDETIYPSIQYQPPQGIDSAAVGYIIDGVVEDRDVLSLILYWADQGFLTIEEKKKGKLILHRVRSLPKDAPGYAQTMFRELFKNEDKCNVEKLSGKFYETIQAVKAQVKMGFQKTNALYTRSSLFARKASGLMCALPFGSFILLMCLTSYTDVIQLIIILVCYVAYLAGACMFCYGVDTWHSKTAAQREGMVTGGITLVCIGLAGYGGAYLQRIENGEAFSYRVLFVLVCAASVFLAFLTAFMRKRTHVCTEWMGKLLGLRDFIETAELDRLQALAEETPELFYHILPYAYVLGVSDVFARKLKGLALEPPQWYVAPYDRSGGYFDYYVFHHSLMHNMDTATKALAVPEPSKISESGSSGSGFSGGGFSGGGFGGGGGGSW